MAKGTESIITATAGGTGSNSNFHEQPALYRIGDFGLKRQGGVIDEEWHRDLKGDKARKMYREMLDNEVIISSSLWVIESLMRQAPWNVVPAETGHPQAEEAACFVEECLDDLDRPFKEIVSEALSCLAFGWCALEPTYKIRRGPEYKEPVLNSKYRDGFFGWRDWEIRAQESMYRWEFDDDGNLIGMWQQPPAYYELIPIPLDRLLLFRIRASKGNPEGRSLLRSVYTAYYHAKKLREIEGIGIERNIAGMPVMQVPLELMQQGATSTQTTARTAYLDMVKKIRMDQYYGLVIPCETGTDGQPTGYKFSLVSSSGKDLGVTDTIIKRWETRMQYQFMTEYMSLGMDRVGSLATSSDKTGMLANSISAIADGIEDVINKDAIPRLMELNGFPVEACPRIKHGDIEKKSIQETFSAVVQGVSSGAMQADASVENMLRDMVDLEPRDTGLELPGLGDALQPPTQEIATEPVQDAAPVEPPPQSLTVGQASELIGAGPNVIRAAIRAGQLPGARVGGQYRVMRDDLMAYMRGAHGQSIRQPE